MRTCEECHGSGKMQPTSTGMESSWKINQWLMQQPCNHCNGAGVVKSETPSPSGVKPGRPSQ